MEFRWTDRDMAEFEKSFPDAHAFLLRRSLMNEYRHLITNSIILNDWQRARVKELEAICGFDTAMVANMNVADFLYSKEARA